VIEPSPASVERLTGFVLLADVGGSIGVDNISDEVGSVKSASSQFLLLLSTPVCLRSNAGRFSVSFHFHPHPVSSAHSLHRPGVAHQTSLRSLLTMMSSSNSPHLGEADRLFRVSINAAQDHVIEQAFSKSRLWIRKRESSVSGDLSMARE